MNESACKIAAVVPNIFLMESGYNEEVSGDAPINGNGRWQCEMLPEKRSR
jgi:hypothetical protein